MPSLKTADHTGLFFTEKGQLNQDLLAFVQG